MPCVIPSADLAYLEQLQGHTAGAVELYKSALQIDGENTAAKNNLAILLARSGELAGAVKLWETIFAANEDLPEIGINLAAGECGLGNQEKAEKALRAVLLYSPDQQTAAERLQKLEAGLETCSRP